MARKGSRRSRERQGELPFAYEADEGGSVTALAGVPLVAELYRACGASEAVRRCVPSRPCRRETGFPVEELAESLLVLMASGGECVDDLQVLRDDEGLAQMLGHALPSPALARQFLYTFHDDASDAAVARRRASEPSFVPPETAALQGLTEALGATVRTAQAYAPEWRATLDVDATIIASRKREASRTYTGEPGYQPIIAHWAEQDVVVADEFRDGNVPASSDVLRCLEKAVAALPDGVERLYTRMDSAGYAHEVMDWCDTPDAEGDPRVIFAISAKMSAPLRRAIEAVPAADWTPLDTKGGRVRHVAQVPYVPAVDGESKARRAHRYIAIRIAPEQGLLFDDGTEVKHFAVVTNDWARDAGPLLDWHRQKAGTVEHVHDEMKNGLGAGVMPCARFGANAAWYRLCALAYNLLSLLKRTALPKPLRHARAKRLRFHVFNRAGRLVHHARQLFVRLAGLLTAPVQWLIAARRAIAALAPLRPPPQSAPA